MIVRFGFVAVSVLLENASSSRTVTYKNVNYEDVLPFLEMASNYNTDLDVMVEAKQKDRALFKLVDDLSHYPGVKKANDAPS